MNLKLTLAALLIAPLALTACAKKDEASNNEAATEEKVSVEKQAAIDSIDQPVLDEKNTDVPADIANAKADEATPATEEAASDVKAH